MTWDEIHWQPSGVNSVKRVMSKNLKSHSPLPWESRRFLHFEKQQTIRKTYLWKVNPTCPPPTKLAKVDKLTWDLFPSYVLRTRHNMSLSGGMMLYFQIMEVMALILLERWPASVPDLLNSFTTRSQKDRRWEVSCLAPSFSKTCSRLFWYKNVHWKSNLDKHKCYSTLDLRSRNLRLRQDRIKKI